MARQAPDAGAVDAAESRHRQARGARKARPAGWSESGDLRMAQRREGGGQEGQSGAGAVRPQQVGPAVGGTGDQAAAPAQHARPAAGAQMHARAERRGQPGIAGHHQGKAACAADPRQVASERCPPRLAVVAQHDAGEAARQARHRRPGIGQPPRVGEQPEAGQLRSRPAGRVCPGEQAPIHRAPRRGCANGSSIMSKRKHAIEAYFQSGVRLQGAGRLAEAEQVYRQVLAAAPGHADSLHMLGVIASQCGQPQAAVACIDQAIAIKPSAAMFHVNRAAALLALRQLDAALAACQAALRLQRNSAEAYQVMGHVLSDLGRPEEALARLSRRAAAQARTCRTCTTTWAWCCARRTGWRRRSWHCVRR